MKLTKLNLALLAFVILILAWSQFFRKKPEIRSEPQPVPTETEDVVPSAIPETTDKDAIPFQGPPPTPESAAESQTAPPPVPEADSPEAERINYFQSMYKTLARELEARSFDEQQRAVILRSINKEFNLAGNPQNPMNLERAQAEAVRALNLDAERSSALGDAMLEAMKQPMETVTIPQLKACLLTRVQNSSSCTVDHVQEFLNEVSARSENDNFWITPEISALAQSGAEKLISECNESEGKATLVFELHIGTCNAL